MNHREAIDTVVAFMQGEEITEQDAKEAFQTIKNYENESVNELRRLYNEFR